VSNSYFLTAHDHRQATFKLVHAIENTVQETN